MDPILGEIRMFSGNFAPNGWALCNGQILSISQNTALFSILGTFYGGDGQTTFGLPNLQGKVAIDPNVTFIIAVQGIYPSRG
jgi:microcystin-dependent protein